MAFKVRLRDVEEDDLPVFLEHQLDPVASRLAVFTPRNREAFAQHWAKILADPAVDKKTILRNGQVVGNVLCFERSGKREVGYWIGREHWGQGIATRALAQFLRMVTTRPLHAVVAKYNAASIRVLQKCGFAIAMADRAAVAAHGPSVEEVLLELGGDEKG
jgi:RimJ/RimL family protein N-acetyltransferase